MPYVDLLSSDDYASLWYTTNSPFGNVGSFNPDKPSLIMLHPMFLDSTWLDMQFGDPRLDSGFNIIAFDMRVCGKSWSKPSGLHDSWVEAADLAHAHHALQLPPCHILAFESISTNCALRFAALFPEMCLSLTLCNVPPPTELRWVFTAYDELLQSWCFADDLDSFEHVGMEAVGFLLGPNCDVDKQDDLIEYWELEMPPCRRQRVLEQVSVLMNRTPLKPQMLASISQPVLIIQGERCETCPMRYAEKLASELVNAKGGAVLYPVKGAVGFLNILPSNASIVNQVFTKFISRLPRARSEIVPHSLSRDERMKLALARLAEFADDTSIANRDPLSPLSFSRLAPEVAKSQFDSLQFYAKDQHKAFSPLGLDGRPVRKFSTKKTEHWFHGERDGISYAGSELASAQKRTKHPIAEQEPVEVPLPMPSSEPVCIDTAHESRLRRATFKHNSIDKVLIKGSITKVLTDSAMPLSLYKLRI